MLRNSKDGASGTGLTTEISKALETAYQRLKYEFDLTATGGSRKGFIKSQKHLDDKSMAKLKEAWEKYYSGNANTVILNDGMEFQEASHSSQQNEIDAKNRSFAEEIKTIFHIGNTYDDFIKNAIMPIATAFVTALNRDFLLEKEKKTYYFAPDTKELLKGNLLDRYNAYRIAIEKGFKTRNEIRYMEDDDAIEGLDMISLGLGDVLLNVDTGEIYTPNTNTISASIQITAVFPAAQRPANQSFNICLFTSQNQSTATAAAKTIQSPTDNPMLPICKKGCNDEH